ncbi:MAG: DNA polymerase III subunit chi [Pseudomonadota bacterium]
MAEALFYHLTRRRLEDALPELLQRTLSKGWRALVRCGAPERAEALNRHLWTFADASFLPHGGPEDGRPAAQPIYLTAGAEAPNGAQVLFLVDGAAASAEEMRGFERCCLLFDGRDEAAVAAARRAWKAATQAKIAAVYWSEASGGWKKAAETEGG